MGNPSETRLFAGWASDVGRVREHNEDACLADTAQGLFIVSDGMGGQQAGATASQIVVKVLPEMIHQRLEHLKRPSTRALRQALCDAIAELSRRIREEATGKLGLQGMGATVVLAYVRGRFAHVAHMGDSRAYLLRNNRLDQLTGDHSITGILLRRGEITARQAKEHPARGQLSRFVGMEGEAIPEARTVELKQRDRLLLCTDGLTGMLTDKRIVQILKKDPEPTVACRALVDAANQAGGKDNITVVIVDYE